MRTTPKPGDHVIHPAHGPGEVVKIEDRELFGETRTYVTIDVDDMRVMVPVEELGDIGIRKPLAEEDAEEIMELLADDPMKDPGHRGRRRRNDKRIRSGEIEELAKVVRSLKALEQDSEKGLKHRDRADLRSAMDRLVAELAIALDIDEEDARRQVMLAVAPEEVEAAEGTPGDGDTSPDGDEATAAA